MVDLHHGHCTTGAYSFDGESYRIDDGVITVADAETARAMVTERDCITWLDGPPDDADSEASDAVAEVQEMHWNTATTAIEDGEYDDTLADLADADLSDAKAEAVADRQAALSDE